MENIFLPVEESEFDPEPIERKYIPDRSEDDKTNERKVVESQKFLLEIVCEKLGLKRERWVILGIGLLIFSCVGVEVLFFLEFGEYSRRPVIPILFYIVPRIGVVLGLGYVRSTYNHTIDGLKFKMGVQDANELKNKLITRKLRILFLIVLYLVVFLAVTSDYFWIQENPDELGITPVSHIRQMGVNVIIFRAIVNAIMWFIFVDAIVMLLNIGILPYKLRKNVDINPYSPDGCGGLTPVGNMIFKVATLCFVILTIGTVGGFGSNQMSSAYILAFLVNIAFWVLVILVFFLPQRGLKSLLKEKKNEELTRLSEKIKKVKSKLSSSEEKIDHMVVSIKEASDTRREGNLNEDFQESILLIGLFYLKKEVEKMRTTSFDASTLNKIKLTSLLPVVGNAFRYAIAYFFNI